MKEKVFKVLLAIFAVIGVIFTVLVIYVAIFDTPSSETETSSSTLSSSSEVISNDSTDTTTSTKSSVIYTDNYIEVTKSGGAVSFKNLTDKTIYVDGEAIFNNEASVNMFDFGYVGRIQPGAVETELISKLAMEGPNPSDDDYVYGGEDSTEKLYRHMMKSGETLTWNGDVCDEDGNGLATISFSFEY